jgi:hypothetical protein
LELELAVGLPRIRHHVPPLAVLDRRQVAQGVPEHKRLGQVGALVGVLVISDHAVGPVGRDVVADLLDHVGRERVGRQDLRRGKWFKLHALVRRKVYGMCCFKLQALVRDDAVMNELTLFQDACFEKRDCYAECAVL